MNQPLFLGLLLSAALRMSASASVADNFESYALDSALDGQGDWQGWGNDAGASAYISNAHASSGSQSVKISDGADQVLTFSSITSGQWTFKIKQYIPSGSSGAPYISLFNKYMPAVLPDDKSIEVICDMNAGKMYDDLAGYAQIAMVKDAWVEWRFEIDFTANTVTTFYNNTLFTTHPWVGGTGTLELAALELYASGCSPIYYDDLAVVPAGAPTHGASDSWASDAAGSWSDVSKWTNHQYPDAVGNVATFSENLTTELVVTVDTEVTVGTIILNDATANTGQDRTSDSGFVLSLGDHNITLDTGTHGYNAADLAVIQVPSSNAVGHQFTRTTGKLILADNTQFDVASNVELGLGEGMLAGEGMLIKTGMGQLLVAGDNSAYAGALRLESGVVQGRGSANCYGSGTIILTNNSGVILSQNNQGGGVAPAIPNNLVLERTAAANNFALNVSQSPGLTWAGNISNSGAPLDVDLAAGSDNGGLSYSLFQYTGNNFFLVFAAGNGFVSGNNYLGVGSDNALGAGNGARVYIGADLTSQQGLLATIATTIAAPIVVAGGGNVSAAVVGANIASGTATYSGKLTLNSTQNSSLRQAFLRSETGATVVFNAGSVIANAAANGAYGPLTKIGGGRVELDGNNTFLGNFSVRSGELVVGHANALGSATTTVNLGETTPVMSAVRVATTLGDTLQPLGSWSNAGSGTYTGVPASLDDITLVAGDRILVKDRGTQNGIYVVQSPTTSWLRATDLDGGAGLDYGQQVKVTAGTINANRVYFQAQRGTGPYPGTNTLNESPPDYHADTPNPDVSILSTGVTLGRNIDVVANGSTGKSILGGLNTAGVATFSGAITLARNLTVTAAGDGGVDFAGTLTGGYGVTKEGDGTVVFSSAKEYSGATTVAAGTLVVNGILASSEVTVNIGATLQGGGHITNGVTVSGTLAPGNPTGTLAAGSAWFNPGGVLAVEVDGAGPGSTNPMGVAGNLNITQASLQLTVPTPLNDPAYVIASYGSLTGTFASVAGLPTGYALNYTYNGGTQIAVVADFSVWAAGFGGGITDTARGADPDRDGMTNQQEYAFGLNPMLGSSVNPITVPLSASTGTFSYTRRIPAHSGLGYTIQTSPTLGADSWTTDLGAVQFVIGTAGEVQSVRVTVSAGLLSAPQLFVRVVAQ